MVVENEWIQELGIYEPGKPIEEVARELGFDSSDDICKLAANENALGPSPKAVKAIQKMAPSMHLYPDGGAYYLRRALAEKLGVEIEQVAVGNGSNELLELIGHVYLDKGDNIVMGDRAFVVYRLVPPVYQACVKEVPMIDYKHDLDGMLAAIDEKTKIVFIANPNNPTGTYLTQEELDRFMSRVPDHVAVVFDEAYIELMPPAVVTDTLKYLTDRAHVYITRTFSKAYGLAGLRIGYCVSSVEGIELLNRVRQPFNTNALAQVAAVAALEDQEHVERTRNMVLDGLAYLQEEFSGLGLELVPSVANFMLLKVGHGRDVFLALQKKKIIVRPMDGYRLPEWIRVTVGTESENQRLVMAVKELIEEGRITL